MKLNANPEVVPAQLTFQADSLFHQRLSLASFLWAGMMILALIVRLDDLNDPPLDFHPTRQLWSAIIARGMYYQDLDLTTVPEWKRQMAVSQWKKKDILEPRVMETLAAAGYRLLGREELWFPRLVSAIFWILGGIPLYGLAKELSNPEGGLAATAIYLFLPYAVIASRSFQPEPLMVSALVYAMWALYWWVQSPTWSRALLAGILVSLAIFLKAVMVFPLFGGMLGLFLGERGVKRSLRDVKMWAIVLLALLPNLVYLYYGTYIGRFLAGSLNGRFFPDLLTNPWFYIRWELKINQVMGHAFLGLSLLGILFFRSKAHRWFVAGLWLGYAAYGLIFNYQTSTHDYYHLPLIPIAALSLSPLVKWAIGQGKSLVPRGKIAPLALAGILVLFLGASAWQSHQRLHEVDYRPLAANYERIGKRVGRRSRVVALTEDYGYRLVYWGWMNVRVWPSYGDQKYREKMGGSSADFVKAFSKRTSGVDFFLVTWFEEFEYQPELEAHLKGNYPVYDQNDAYMLFDLRKP
jgi:hypothetical protein